MKLDNIVQVEGDLQGTCAPVEHLKDLNEQMYPILQELKSTTYFRTYKVNMENECPFWAQQRLCNNNKCAVCECEDHEIPFYWQTQKDMSQSEMSLLSYMDAASSTIPQKEAPESEYEWCADTEQDQDCIYINLEDNVETYTGYDGAEVWQAIYNENCMIDSQQAYNNLTCSEETILFQFISGLHASVNTHITHNFYDMESDTVYMNYPMYVQKVGAHQERIENMFFIYAAVLRAVNRASDLLRSQDYSTGLDQMEDILTHQKLNDLLTLTIAECEQSFDETKFFNGQLQLSSLEYGRQERLDRQLQEIQHKFYNISRIFDCITCDKCRFNGKVQIKGLGAAIKLLFMPVDQQLLLERTEIIGLINLLNKLSESIHFYEEFQQYQTDNNRFY
jgi:ERO1-like protein alpha